MFAQKTSEPGKLPRAVAGFDDLAPASAPVATAAESFVMVKLSRPLPTHKGDVGEIRLRRPSFGEFIELGEIERLVQIRGADDQQTMLESRIDRDRLMRWASRLSGIDQTILATLSPVDGYSLSREVVRIVSVFVVGNSQGEPPSSPSSSA